MPLVVKKIEKTIGMRHFCRSHRPRINVTAERIPGLGPLIEKLTENISGTKNNRLLGADLTVLCDNDNSIRIHDLGGKQCGTVGDGRMG